MEKQKLKNLIIIAVFVASIIPLGFSLYKSVTLNLEWNWSEETTFVVYRDAGHLEPYLDQEVLNLGSFNPSSTFGTVTFYVVNDGETAIEVLPHWIGTNIEGSFDSVDLLLGIGAEYIVTFSYSVNGTGQAQVWFDTPS